MDNDNLADTASSVFGTRAVCAQCHNHPFEKWMQMEFYQTDFRFAVNKSGVGHGIVVAAIALTDLGRVTEFDAGFQRLAALAESAEASPTQPELFGGCVKDSDRWIDAAARCESLLERRLTGMHHRHDLLQRHCSPGQMGHEEQCVHGIQCPPERFECIPATQKEQWSRFHLQRKNWQLLFLNLDKRALDTFTVVPPGIGIVHQVNLEYPAKGVLEKDGVFYPDSLVGTDSHTTMINGLGVVGWGVGGIEAEAGMLGQPVTFLVPEVVGVYLSGELAAGVTATDLVLRVTELLRKTKVVGKFVEFYGPGAKALSVPDRATIANIAPEYGATMGFFGIDEETVAYMRGTGRSEELCKTVESYYKAQGLWGIPTQEGVLIAFVTSCSNTSNPGVMIAAGLLAKKSNPRCLTVKPSMKTSLGPGSRLVTDYFDKTGLQTELDKLGCQTVAYGCTTCIGNSGPLDAGIEHVVKKEDIVAACVLSGNRTFEALVHHFALTRKRTFPANRSEYAMQRSVTLFTGQWADLSFEISRHTALGLRRIVMGQRYYFQGLPNDQTRCDVEFKSINLQCHAISMHLVGQAVGDNLGPRHKQILPDYIYGDGNPEGVRQRAAEELIKNAHAAMLFGVSVVNGFTGSSIWHLVYSFPPNLPGYPRLCFNCDPSRFGCQGVDYGQVPEIGSGEMSAKPTAMFHRNFFGLKVADLLLAKSIFKAADRIFHAHMKDVAWGIGHHAEMFGGDVSFQKSDRYCDFKRDEHSHIEFDEIIQKSFVRSKTSTTAGGFLSSRKTAVWTASIGRQIPSRMSKPWTSGVQRSSLRCSSPRTGGRRV